MYLSSGGAVYGNPGDAPEQEQNPLNPFSYYAAGKIAIEAFIKAMVQQSPRYAEFYVLLTFMAQDRPTVLALV